jgi:hypothetical protein
MDFYCKTSATPILSSEITWHCTLTSINPLMIHPSGKYVTLAIVPCFCVCDISQTQTSQSQKWGALKTVTCQTILLVKGRALVLMQLVNEAIFLCVLLTHWVALHILLHSTLLCYSVYKRQTIVLVIGRALALNGLIRLYGQLYFLVGDSLVGRTISSSTWFQVRVQILTHP